MLAKLWYLVLVVAFLGVDSLPAQTVKELETNRQTCLSGRYPALCNKDWLSAEESALARKAELADNLRGCLAGNYSALCNHDWLTPEELQLVRAAEARENLDTCLSGKYTSLCNKNLLSAEELRRVREAENAENLRVCLDGRFPSACDHSRLPPEQAEAVQRAGKTVPRAAEVIEIPFSEEPESPASVSTPKRRSYTTSSLRLRLIPSLDGEVLATLPRGSALEVAACSVGWCEAYSGSIAGYVAERYLSAKPPPPATAPTRERSSGRGYINSSGEWVPSPTWTEDGRPPAGATARCRDGSYSYSRSRRGTCSHHGGVARWL
jgi:hypothetical protein